MMPAFRRIEDWLTGWTGAAPNPPAAAVAAAVAVDDEEPAYKPIDAKLIRRLLGWIRPYRRRYMLGIGLGTVMIVLELLGPLFIGRIVAIASAYRAAADRSPAGESAAIRSVVTIVGIWAAAFALSLLVQRAQILIMASAGERVQFDLRRALFTHLQRLSMSYYDRTRLGRIISRCTSDLGSMRDINVWGLDTVAKNGLMMVFAAAMLLATEPRLFAAVAWLGPVLFVCNRIYRRRAAVQHQIAREGYTRVATNLAENITGVRVVAAFNRQALNLDTFNRLQTQNTVNNVQAARINGVYQPLLQLIGAIGRIIILLYGAYLVLAGRLPGGIGAVVTAFLYWDWFINPIMAFGNFHNQLLMAMAGAERVFQLLDTKPEVLDEPGAVTLPRLEGRIRFEHITFGYRADRPVLHDVDFEIEPGQTAALVGATGSGKSSIISLVARFYQPQSGRVLIDGFDLRRVAADSLHHQTGIVLQSNFLFTGTVMDNIRYARPEATDPDVIRAARDLGTFDAIEALAGGFQTRVGERGANISLGERQLVCFTRAFLADPRILLLDEATSAVDTATEMVIQRSLETLLRGRTTFVVAHRLSTIERADVILVVDAGRIVERGRHSELLRSAGIYSRLHRQFVSAS
jgi:ATP-binding cassette subfamily B protein